MEAILEHFVNAEKMDDRRSFRDTDRTAFCFRMRDKVERRKAAKGSKSLVGHSGTRHESRKAG
jgi:hypothetical protein